MIAHRLSAIKNADCILMIDQGEIKERGAYSDLLKKGELFKTLHDKQYSKRTS